MPADAVSGAGRSSDARHARHDERNFEAGGHSDSASADRAPEHPSDVPAAGWLAIVKRSFKQFKHDNVTDYAAALTYFGILAIFPAVLALVSILGLLGKNQTNKVVANLSAVAPGAVTDVLKAIITQVQGKAGTAGPALIVSLLLALWSASGYVAAFMRASNAIYGVEEGRPIWKTAPVRLLVTLILVVLLAASAIMVVATGPVAKQLGSAFGIGGTAVLVWDIAKWPVLLIVVSLMFSLLYKACPNVKQPGLRWISLGGVIAVVVWIIASALFALYVSFSGSYNKTYGSFATAIVFLVWLWITNIAILLGAEINAEAQRERAIQAGLPPDMDQFAPLRDTKKLDEPQKREAREAGELRDRYMND